MKAYLIRPRDCSIVEVDYTGDYRNIYEHLSEPAAEIEVTCFDVVRLDDGDGCYVDDEGLFKPSPMFMIGDREIRGQGLVLGSDSQGNATEPKISLEDLRALIAWQVVPGFRLYAKFPAHAPA